MELVIKIPDEDYKNTCSKPEYLLNTYSLAIKNAILLERVFDDIKAEIEHIADYTYGSTNYDADLYNGAYKDGLYEAIDVIDKHISGKEQD